MSRPFPFGLSVFVVAVGVSALCVPAAQGQYYGQPPQQQVQRAQLQTNGTVKQLTSAGVVLLADNGDQWLVQIDPQRPDVSYSATGDATIVKQGQWVQFSTKLTKRGSAAAPLASVSIFTPKADNEVGVASEASLAGGGAGNINAFFGDAKKEEPKPKPQPKDDENTVYRVAGQITKITRLGELSINAAGITIKAELAENAKVAVNVADLGWLQVGDKVEMRGWHVMGQKGPAWATQFTATAAQPLTDPKKKPKPTPMATAPDGQKPAAEGTTKPAEGEKKPAEAKTE